MKPVAVQAAKFGEFYSGDCYVVLYKYKENAGRGKEVQIIYFWIGSHSSVDERGAAAAFVVELDTKMGGKPIQMRIVQGKEPPHFMLIFRGTLIVRQGGVKSAFKQTKKDNGYDGDTEPEDNAADVEQVVEESKCHLFHVKGSSSLCCKAIEVEASAANLNSNDVFVVSYDITTYVWYGKGSNSLEMKTGDYLATTLVNKSSPMIGVHEGEEPSQFWSLLGGEQDYASSVSLSTPDGDYPARMFHVSNAKGYIAIEEIVDYSQEDLIEDDVVIMDCYDEIFVWIGANANEEERKGGLKIATEYLESDPSGRDPDNVTMYQIRQGFEPPNFRAHFSGWDFRFKKHLDNGEKGVSSVQEELATLEQDFFSYLELANGKCPGGVDPCRKEDYLTDKDFEAVFGMARDSYSRLANWRKINLKKEKKLF